MVEWDTEIGEDTSLPYATTSTSASGESEPREGESVETINIHSPPPLLMLRYPSASLT